MDKARLVEVFSTAKDVVTEAGLEPESRFGEIAFERSITALIEEDEVPAVGASAEAVSGAHPEEAPVASVARWLDTSAQKLLDVFEFTPDGVEIQLWHARLPERKSECQRLLALIKLGLEHVGYDREDVPARDINALCSRYGCLDQNLPTNLQNYRNYVVRRGQRGAYSYRLTHAGLQAAREGLKTLIDV